MMSKRRRGFSLAELGVVLVIALLIFAVTAPLLQRPKTQAETHAVSLVIAEEMRQARSRAIAQQVPVAVVFPSDYGAKPFSQSYYVLEGESDPQVTRTVDFSRQYPNVCVFNGYWELDPSRLSDASRTNTTTAPVVGAGTGDFAMGSWSGGSSDCAFVFLPSGVVLTNGLVNFDGQYHLVTSQGGAAEPGTVAEAGDGFVQAFSDVTTFFKLKAVRQPYTINLTPLGEVTVSSGVTGATAALTVEQPVPMPQTAPPAAPPSPPAGSPLVVVGNPVDDLQPASLPSTRPVGVDATISGTGTVTWTLHATGTSGNPLFVTWTAAPASGSGPSGSLSHTDAVRMEWDASLGQWVAAGLWKPPVGALAGASFVLTASVTDRVSAPTVATRVVQVVADRIVFTSRGTASLDYQVYVMNADGTNRTRLTDAPGTQVQLACVSPDGKRIAYHLNDTGTGALDGIWIMNANGSNKRQLTSGANDPPFAFSSDGTRIVFRRGNPGTLFIMNSDGSGLQTLSTSQAVFAVSFSPDGSRLAYARPYNPSDIVVQDLSSGAVTNLTSTSSAGVDHHAPMFSPDGTRIAFLRRVGSGTCNVFVMDATNADLAGNPEGQNVSQLTSTGVYAVAAPSWSPDGSRISNVGGGIVITIDAVNPDLAANPGGRNPKTLVSDGATWNAYFSR